jgi:hypothetical protein
MWCLCGGAGAETQTSGKCCSEDKATDFEATGDFHDEPFSVFSTKGGTARLSKSNTPALRVDQGFELSRGTKCRMPVRSSNGTARASEFVRRRHHFMEHDPSAAGCRSPSKARAPSGARRSCPSVALGLEAHQPDRRLPTGYLSDSRGQTSFSRFGPVYMTSPQRLSVL